MKLQHRFQNTTPHCRASVGQHPCAPPVTSQLSFVVIHLIAQLTLVCFHCVPAYGELHVALEIPSNAHRCPISYNCASWVFYLLDELLFMICSVLSLLPGF